jgi:hypothetical protein
MIRRLERGGEPVIAMSEIGDFRKSKDQYFGGDPISPLTSEQRKGFKRLKYFAENADL